MNPYLPSRHCVPDGEARVFGDRCYIYGSYDLENDNDYCSNVYHVFSAPLSDLDHWTDHGIALASGTEDSPIAWSQARLYAPDVCEKGGKYYMYFCLADGTEGVAVSQRPEGPFLDPVQLFYPASVQEGRPLHNIDPSIFIDDDGSAYYYWGQYHLQAARLEPDMHTLREGTYVENLITESTHWFHEGASMRKINGKYYLVFCSIVTGRANTLDYAVGDSPLGPFRYGGSILNNRSCDPESWNIHGCIQQVGEDFYVFYHRSSNCSFFSRRACAERITFLPDGSIQPAEMTSMGFSKSLPARQVFPALAFCSLTGRCYFTGTEEGVILTNICSGSQAVCRYVDFPGTPLVFSVRLKIFRSGILNLRLDSPTAEPAARLSLEPGPDWQELSVPLVLPEGRRCLCLDFHTPSGLEPICQLQSFRFSDNCVQ